MKVSDIPGELEKIRQADRFRQVQDLRMVTAARGVRRDGKGYIVFSSNDYLGMTHEKEVQEAAAQAVSYGTGSGGARLTSGAVFEASDLERELAAFKHTAEAVVFNTGYMANLGILYALAGPGDVIFSDELNHASIVDGCRISRAKVIVYPHSDMKRLQELLETCDVSGQRFIVSDGVFSMDGDIADLPCLLALKKKYDACLIIDDAHATGVIGKTGRGTAEYYGASGADITVGTLSKALGSQGGYAAADEAVAAYIRNRSRPFIFSTAMPAMSSAAALAALRLLEQFPERYVGRLKENTDYMRALLRAFHIPLNDGRTPILPIILGDERKTLYFERICREKGIIVSAIRPPTVAQGTCRIRLSITAAHAKEDLETAAAVIQEAWKAVAER
ncbi:MAG: 8-amino-7-oxononanoate synthase [Dialister sp.]|nr:8-amino-7-oxononanoate synthase [Dialister sp.]